MLRVARVAISDNDVEIEGEFAEFFDFLDNNGGLTEEFLYQHQPDAGQAIAVYATSPDPIGHLSRATAQEFGKTVLEGPVIVVARKGYAGRLFVVEDSHLIVQEDAYAVRPKPGYRDRINLNWFAAHYSDEFQSFRTSIDGIGDFPRMMLKSRRIRIPSLRVQIRIANLYQRRTRLLEEMADFESKIEQRILSS